MLTTLLLLVPILSAQAPTRSAPVVLELDPYFGSLCTLTLTSGEFRGKFLFDTGGGVTLLSLVAAKTLAIEPFGRGTGFRHDGTRVDRPRGGPVTLSAGGWAQRGEIGVIDLAAMLPGLPPVDGILALDFFRGDALTIDLAKKRLTLETPASLTARTQGAPEVELRLAHQAAGAALDVMVGVEGLHGTLWFELDSGNVAPVLVAPHSLVELGLEPLALGKRAHVELPILGLGLEPVEIEAKDLIYDGLLNAAFFERHVLTLDLARGRGWARRTTK
jgi:hypothetical protein